MKKKKKTIENNIKSSYTNGLAAGDPPPRYGASFVFCYNSYSPSDYM